MSSTCCVALPIHTRCHTPQACIRLLLDAVGHSLLELQQVQDASTDVSQPLEDDVHRSGANSVSDDSVRHVGAGLILVLPLCALALTHLEMREMGAGLLQLAAERPVLAAAVIEPVGVSAKATPIVLTNKTILRPAVLVNTRRSLMSHEPLTPPAELPTDIVILSTATLQTNSSTSCATPRSSQNTKLARSVSRKR